MTKLTAAEVEPRNTIMLQWAVLGLQSSMQVEG
jgi:hypothetical protein